MGGNVERVLGHIAWLLEEVQKPDSASLSEERAIKKPRSSGNLKEKSLHPQPLYCGIASINARIEILPWRRKAFSIELITSSKSLMISMNERLAAQPRLLNKEVLGTWVHRV
ncbi:hypothetical protein RhiirB3_533080 [Rhizophagus irregularis]|nr:hypothetical protein RhiirB3_533080 [Rhizophagus irregularis]